MASIGSSYSGAAPEAAPAAAEVVIGLLSYNDAETVGGVVGAVREGVAGHCGSLRCRIALVDGGSSDGTAAQARQALHGDGMLVELAPPRATADKLALPYHGMPGRARALHSVLGTARDLQARVCVVLDAAVRTVSPHWIEWMARPVLDHDVDLVSPFYHRQAYEGALTKGLVYPVFRALYGMRLRQPAASEFACSARLLERLLHEDLWEREGAQVGIDLWLAATAAAGEFRLAEAALGVRSHHSRGEGALDLAATVTQVVGSLFADLERRAERWQRTRGSTPVHQFGTAAPAAPPAAAATLDVERLFDSFRLGFRELRDIWTWVLPPRTILDLRRLADNAPPAFVFADDLWARIVYDFAVAYRLRVLARDHLLQSIVPLYLGWLASFVLQVRDADPGAVDERVETLAQAFEGQKPHLISRWRWPERLRT